MPAYKATFINNVLYLFQIIVHIWINNDLLYLLISPTYVSIAEDVCRENNDTNEWY